MIRAKAGLVVAFVICSGVGVVHATSPVNYYHAAVCQEYEYGESGFIHRYLNFVRNEDTADVIRTVICPVGREDLVGGTGTTVSVTFNIYSASGGTQTYTLRRHNDWGSIVEYNSVAALGSGNYSWTMAVSWSSASNYTFSGALPSMFNSQDFRFYSYAIQRL